MGAPEGGDGGDRRSKKILSGRSRRRSKRRGRRSKRRGRRRSKRRRKR